MRRRGGSGGGGKTAGQAVLVSGTTGGVEVVQ